MQFGLVLIWRWRRDRKSMRNIWIGLFVATGLVTVSTWVVTPTEQIINLCRELAALAKSEDVDGIGHRLSGDFHAGEFDRDRFLARTQATLTRFDIDHVKLRTFDVAFVDGDRAMATFNAVCRISGAESISGIFVSRWRLTFRNEGEDWLLAKIEAIPTAFSPIHHIRDCFR